MLVGVGKKLHFGEKKTRVFFEIHLKKIVFLQSSCYKPDSIFKVSCEKSTEKIVSRDVNISLVQEDGAMFSVNFDQIFQLPVTLYQDETCVILNDYLIKTVRFIIKQISIDSKAKEVVQDVGSFSLNLSEFAQFNEPVEKEVEFMESLNKGFVAFTVRNGSPSPAKILVSERRNSYGDSGIFQKEISDDNKQASSYIESTQSIPKSSASDVSLRSDGSLSPNSSADIDNVPALRVSSNTISPSQTVFEPRGLVPEIISDKADVN